MTGNAVSKPATNQPEDEDMDDEDSMEIKDEDIDQYLENEQRAMMVAMGGKARGGENPLVPYTH